MLGMNNMVTPKIERVAEARAYGKYEISPLERGYGITLGNALRRVMLSSMEGAAVTSIRITEIDHELGAAPDAQGAEQDEADYAQLEEFVKVGVLLVMSLLTQVGDDQSS